MLTVAFVLSLAINATAQIKKGTILLGGQIAGASGNNKQANQFTEETVKIKSFVFGTSIGKAIKENNIIGINVGAGFSNYRFRRVGFDSSSSTSNSFNAALFYRKYKKLAKDFYFFGEATGGFGMSKQNNIPSNFPTEYNRKTISTYLSLTPGISYKVFKKMQLEVTLPNIIGAYYSKSKDVETSTSNSKGYSTNFSLNTGLSNQLLSSLSLGFRLFL